MADSSKSDDLDATPKPAVPAWKLRQSLKEGYKGAPLKRNSTHNVDKLRKKSSDNLLDPNLPPAFKTVLKERAAFQRQQARRKNNDEFVSLNSSHPEPAGNKEAEDSASDYDSFDDDSFGEEIIDEEEEYEEIEVSEDEAQS